MPNDISGINSGRTQQSGERQVGDVRREGDASTSRSGGGAGTQDKVVLTEMAARLKSLEQKLASQPEIDQARVDNVREAISRGEYRINPDRVADKMMDFESDF